MEKIAAVLIMKNEERLIRRCLESCRDADEIVILDTGSTDRSVEFAQDCGAKVYATSPILPFHFAEARNRALAHVKSDWCVSVDADEVVREGALKTIRRAVRKNAWAGAMNVTFVMRSEKSDKPYPILKTKVFRKSMYEWRYRVHELLFPKKGKPALIEVPAAVIEHQPLPDKVARHGQNYELLKLCVEESPEYIRASRQLALELMLRKEWQAAIPHMARWLELIPVDDPLEKSEACCQIGECYAELGQLEKASEWFYQGGEEAPNRREPYYRLAWWMLKSARLDEALLALGKLFKVPRKDKPNFHLTIDKIWDDEGEPRAMANFCKEEIARAKKLLEEKKSQGR